MDSMAVAGKTYLMLLPLILILLFFISTGIITLLDYLRVKMNLTVNQFYITCLLLIQILILYLGYITGWLEIIIKHFFG